MADPRPHLEVVGGGGSAEPEPEGPPARGRFLLLALAVGLAALLGLQSWRAAGLAERVEVLSGELASTELALGAARTALAAHEAHPGQVCASVAGLEASLAELRAVVDAAPAEPAGPRP